MPFIVVSLMKLRAMVDASDYQELLFEESDGLLEPEFDPTEEGELSIITKNKVDSIEEAEDLANLLRSFSFGDPPRPPQVGIKELSLSTQQPSPKTRRRRVVEPSKPQEEEFPKVDTSEETPYRLNYRTTQAFKESQKRYQQSTAGKEAHRRYSQSIEGRAKRDAYYNSPKGVQRRKEFQERQKAERKLYTFTGEEAEGPVGAIVDIIEIEAKDPTRFIGAEAILAIMESEGVGKVEAHSIFQTIINSGVLVEVRR